MPVKKLIITNNPMVADKYRDKYPIIYNCCTCMEILETARDKVHMGHRLLTHPLTGGIKPGEAVYKTILVSSDAGGQDFQSLMIIEDSISVFQKFLGSKGNSEGKKWDDKTYEDFQTVDMSFIVGCIDY